MSLVLFYYNNMIRDNMIRDKTIVAHFDLQILLNLILIELFCKLNRVIFYIKKRLRNCARK